MLVFSELNSNKLLFCTKIFVSTNLKIATGWQRHHESRNVVDPTFLSSVFPSYNVSSPCQNGIPSDLLCVRRE